MKLNLIRSRCCFFGITDRSQCGKSDPSFNPSIIISTITEHLQNVFKEGELNENVVCRNFRHTTQHGAIEGKTQDKEVKLYNLDVIISVGYRVKSPQGTQFRIWATQRLKEYLIKGFALNDDRFKSGSSMNYFNELQERIREIRISERFFYQKIKDIYTTSIDYDPKDEKTVEFCSKNGITRKLVRG